MNPEEEMPPGEEHRAYHRQKVWKRIVVAAAGPAVNIVLAFVILFAVFESAGWKRSQAEVGETRGRLTGRARSCKPGDRIVAVDGHRFARLERRRTDRKVRQR